MKRDNLNAIQKFTKTDGLAQTFHAFERKFVIKGSSLIQIREKSFIEPQIYRQFKQSWV